MNRPNIPFVNLNFTEPGQTSSKYEFGEIIFDLDHQISLLSSQADSLDYLIAAASAILCASMDVLWVGEFSLQRGKSFSQNQITKFVIQMAKISGYKGNDLQKAVVFLQNKFPIPADSCSAKFGGGPQHHLRDFAHHPNLLGLAFSLLTQFTGKCYGIGKDGSFTDESVPESGTIFIGKSIPDKIIKGTIIWFFHLVSDIAGSSSTVCTSGGTGIPGPLLRMAREISALPIFQNKKNISAFLSKLFNGTLFAKHDANGKIIRESVVGFDLRAELGIAEELGRQALPVIANDCIVRLLYFIRRLTTELKVRNISSFADFKDINWSNVTPHNNPTIDRMLLIATGIFTTIDISSAAISDNFLLSINYVGVGRLLIAIGKDVSWFLKRRKLYKVKQMYKTIDYYTFRSKNFDIYRNLNSDTYDGTFEVTVEQARILYNLEYLKIMNDINITETPLNKEAIKSLKREWLQEWKQFITEGFANFIQNNNSEEMVWYDESELFEILSRNHPEKSWFRVALIELMLFEPYYPLSVEKDKKGKMMPSPKYKDLQGILGGYKRDDGDVFIEELFCDKKYYSRDYIKRLRKSFEKISAELNKTLQTAMKTVAITAAASAAAVLISGAFAPSIAVALVGSQFAGLHGAALVNASLAFLGGGALAVGGAGMAGGTAAIIGGGAVLGVGIGIGVSSTSEILSYDSKKTTIQQYSKLITTLKEIILNDEHDYHTANLIYERVVQKLVNTGKELAELEIRLEDLQEPEKGNLENKIKQIKEIISIMKTARHCLKKIVDSYDEEEAESKKLRLTGDERIDLLLPEPNSHMLLLN